MADFSEQGSPAAAAQNGPDVYVLPLTEVSLPMAKQPGRSGKRTCLPPRIVSWGQQAVEVCGSLRTRFWQRIQWGLGTKGAYAVEASLAASQAGLC